MDVLLNFLGHLEVDDMSDVVYVETPGSDRRGDQDGMFPWTGENTGMKYRAKTYTYLS